MKIEEASQTAAGTGLADERSPEYWVPDGATAVEWLSRDNRPRLILNRSLQLLWSNPAAKSRLAPGLPVFLKDGRLCFDAGADPAKWRRQVKSAGPGKVRIRISSVDGTKLAVLSYWSRSIGDCDAVLMTVSLGTADFDVRAHDLTEQFGLTIAEAQVAKLLIDLNPPQEIAKILGVKINTVRTHIRHIYSKLGIRSQTQYLQLIYTYYF